jgi:hypothetical protein
MFFGCRPFATHKERVVRLMRVVGLGAGVGAADGREASGDFFDGVVVARRAWQLPRQRARSASLSTRYGSTSSRSAGSGLLASSSASLLRGYSRSPSASAHGLRRACPHEGGHGIARFLAGVSDKFGGSLGVV